MADDRKLEEDQLVSKLIPDPTQGPPNAVSLRGYLGKAPAPSGKGKETLWRLYTSPALDEYAEIPESEILHSQKLPDEQGTIVWVPRTLQLHYVHVHSAQIQAELLGSGSIAQTRLPTTPIGPGGGILEPTSEFGECDEGWPPITFARCPTFICPPTLNECRSEFCRSFVLPCLSDAPSHCTICPTRSATASHCTHCPPLSIAVSHCGPCTPTHPPLCLVEKP
jgi:hypothetical protein